MKKLNKEYFPFTSEFLSVAYGQICKDRSVTTRCRFGFDLWTDAVERMTASAGIRKLQSLNFFLAVRKVCAVVAANNDAPRTLLQCQFPHKPKTAPELSTSQDYPSLTRTRTPPRRSCTTIFFKFISLDDIAQVAHNKVLVAAAVSAGIGQLLKPFSSSWLYGKDFSLSSAIQAGGFPSTHSSAVIATATSIALERGFADPIFGMAVVYASLVMYDAQGVRREVGDAC
ncbi:unnamed protein product [Rhodiola kirilowii]